MHRLLKAGQSTKSKKGAKDAKRVISSSADEKFHVKCAEKRGNDTLKRRERAEKRETCCTDDREGRRVSPRNVVIDPYIERRYRIER